MTVPNSNPITVCLFITIVLSVLFTQSQGFSFYSSSSQLRVVSQSSRLHAQESENGDESSDNKNESKGFINEFFDMFKNFDDVAEDFFYKRMGKGEIFYGKRKYKPSGDVEGEYNGFGLSDKLKIDMTREYKEAWLEEKRMRDEMRMIREEKEARDRSR